MRFSISPLVVSLLTFLLSPPCLAVSSPDLPNVITLSYESILSDSSAKPLATILYNPQTLKSSLSSWTPPSVPSVPSSSKGISSQLVRILLPSGSSTLTSISTFNETLAQGISLHLSPSGDGTVYSASISAFQPLPEDVLAKPSSSKKKTRSTEAGAVSKVTINIVPPRAGPMAKLNTRKPPVVGADGREMAPENEQPEKSFFQKYWWVFILVTVVAMAGGGDK